MVGARFGRSFVASAAALLLIAARTVLGTAAVDQSPQRLPAEMLLPTRWEPISLSFAAFGQVKLTGASIRWETPQASRSASYRLDSSQQDGSTLIQLTGEPLPKFNGLAYRHLRLRIADEGKHLILSYYKDGEDLSGPGAYAATYFKAKAHSERVAKRGLAGWTGGTASTASAWYYNWWISPDRAAGERAQFVPMIKHAKELNDNNLSDILRLKESEGVSCLLGFNEPERQSQGERHGIGGNPALAAAHGDGSSTGQPRLSADAAGMKWLDEFMTQAQRNRLRVDFIALHWYQDTASENCAGQLHALAGERQSPISAPHLDHRICRHQLGPKPSPHYQ